MPNVIQEYQEALNTTPQLKVNVAPAFTPPTQAPIQQVPAIPIPTPPPPLQPTQPQQQPTDIPSTGEGVPPIPQVDALSFGETVSRLSAQSAQDIQKLLDSSGQPKPNEVQKQLLGNTNPVQIDTKLTSQNNPFASGLEPRNSAERLAFEPARLANGMLNPFSDANAIAALQAGVPKGEYLSYKRALDNFNKDNSPSPIFNFGFQDKANANVQKVNDSLVGLNAEQIRVKMRSVDNYGQMNSSFNRSFMPFLGEDRGSLETIFGLLSFPANLVKGVATDTVLRPAAALMSGGFNVDEFKKAYEALRPTRGGTYTGAAVLGEQFSSMAVTDEKDKPFNPFAVVRDENSLLQASIGLGLDVLLDPLNLPIGKAFNRFRRSAITPPSIIPEVLSPTKQLPRPNVAGALPEARLTIDISSVLDSPIKPSPPAPNRTLVTPANRMRLPETTIAQDVTISQSTVGRTVAQDGVTQVRDLTIPQKRAEPSIASSYESLARYEPSEVVFPAPRQPFTPSLDIQVKVEPSDIQLYNNVTALFNDSPQLTVIQQAVREVVEQKPITVELPRSSVLQEVVEYGRTGELTPNIAVLKGATPDEVRAIVQDKLEVMRETSFDIPRLEVQPITVPKLEFDITRQVPAKPNIVDVAVARLPETPTLATELRISPDGSRYSSGYTSTGLEDEAYKVLSADFARFADSSNAINFRFESPQLGSLSVEKVIEDGKPVLKLWSIKAAGAGEFDTALRPQVKSNIGFAKKAFKTLSGATSAPIIVSSTVNPRIGRILEKKGYTPIKGAADGIDYYPVSTSKPVVVTDSLITSVSELQNAAKGVGTLGEVSQWSVRGELVMPLKEVLFYVDDLGVVAFNDIILARVVKAKIGKLSNSDVKDVALSFQFIKKQNEELARTVFDALWRKSTPDQKEIILGKISATRLEQLGLEKVQTKVTPPTLPTLQHVQASVLDDATVSAYQVVNNSEVPIERLRVALLREQGFSGRDASSMKVHPLSEEMSQFGEVYDESLIPFLNSRELSISTPAEQKWSSKMLQQIWEVSTPQQKAYIMSNVDNLEQLGLERIAHSNVIDDFLPPEGVFDTPC